MTVRSKLRIAVLILVAAALIGPTILLAGGKTEEPAAAGAKKPYEMVLVTKLPAPWFVNMEEGLKEAGKDYGFNAFLYNPSAYDPALQVKAIEDMIAKGVDAILCTPDDAKSLEPVFKKARSLGIAVVTNESPDQNENDYDVEMVDNVKYGEYGMEQLIKAAGNKKTGKYVVFVGSLTVPNHNIWADSGIAWAKKNFPGWVQATDRIPASEDASLARQKALEIIKAYPDIDGFLCWGSQGPPGAAQAVREKGLQGKVLVVGGTTPNQAKQYLKDGSMTMDVLYSPKWGAYSAAYIAMLVLDKKPIFDGMEIPKVGKAKLENGKNLTVHNVLPITKDNVDQYDF